MSTNRFWFCVEDPFEITHNLGRVVQKAGYFFFFFLIQLISNFQFFNFLPRLYDIRGEFMRGFNLLTSGKLTELFDEYQHTPKAPSK